MRIATLTWHTGNNYGSTMQAYALQTVLKQMGHTTELLSYSPDILRKWMLKFRNHSVKATLDYKLNEFYVKIKSRGNHAAQSNLQLFDLFRQKHMLFSSPYSTRRQLSRAAEEYDAFICGSDQIWSPFYYDPVYALDFADDCQKIAYAPSFGVSEIPERSRQWLAKGIGQITHLSVRETVGAQLVHDLTGKTAQVVADPVLLLPSNAWSDIAKDMPQGKPYVVCYFLRKNEQYYKVVQGIAEQYGYDVKVIPMVSGDFKREEAIKEPVGPQEWLGLIKNASWVVTDSFHCTAFSIIFQKNFSTFRAFSNQDKRSQNSRIDNLLDITGLQDRVVDTTGNNMITCVPGKKWEQAQQSISDYAEKSLQWLKDALDSVAK